MGAPWTTGMLTSSVITASIKLHGILYERNNDLKLQASKISSVVDNISRQEATVPFWPFKRRPAEPLAPKELRDRLIEAAASGSNSKLRALCRQYKDQVAANVDLMCKAPDGMPTDSASVDRYVQSLGAVAQCLANQCNAPELWKKLCGPSDNNPLIQWQRWYDQFLERMNRLEYDALITEARGFIEHAQKLKGSAAQQNEAFLSGRLGELLFRSGRMCEAKEAFLGA